MTKKPINIVVLLREACDPRPPVRLTADGYGVRERGLRRIANPADLCALEQGLALAEAHNGTVTAIAIGPQRLEIRDDLEFSKAWYICRINQLQMGDMMSMTEIAILPASMLDRVRRRIRAALGAASVRLGRIR